MPWDGALPMLQHGPLQLKVIAFPVSPSSFFPVLLLPPPVPCLPFFTSAGSLPLPCAGARASYSLSSPFTVLLPFVLRSLWLSLPSPLEPPLRDGCGPAAALLTALRVCEHVARVCMRVRAFVCKGEVGRESLSVCVRACMSE